MCLTELCHVEAPDTGFGWKFFNHFGRYIETPFTGYETFKEDVWEKALRVLPIETDRGESYAPGFHVFLTKEEAEAWWQPVHAKLYQVEYRGIVATGLQGNHLCLVVKEVRIVPVHQETTQAKASD